MILYWPTLVLVAPLVVTAFGGRTAWVWLSLAAGLGVVWAILMIVSWDWAQGRTGGVLAPLMQARSLNGNVDLSFHDTYYVSAHLKWLGGLAIPAAIIALVQFLSAHPKRTRLDISIFWATIVTFVATTAGPEFYLKNGGMPHRYIDYENTFVIMNALTLIGSAIAFACALTAVVRPFWSWWRSRKHAHAL